MKKFLGLAAIIAAFALALALIGCSNASDSGAPFLATLGTGQGPNPTPAPTASPTGQEPTPTVTPLYSAEELETPLTLEAIEDGLFVVINPWSTLKYKINDGDILSASDLPCENDTIIISVSQNDKISFFAEGSENDFSNDNEIAMLLGGNKPCYVYGNAMSLLDSENYSTKTAIEQDYAFACLFYDIPAFKDHPEKKIVLPATTLTKGCYMGMFFDSPLENMPKLPATTLAESCYEMMFYCCENLTTAPALPATVLAKNCYKNMFERCENLTGAPELPATVLAESCYQGMFNECENLTAAPALPATTLAEGCYRQMFSGCIKLENAPELPATTLAPKCYLAMFMSCLALPNAPALPATTLAEACYSSMFTNCENLTKAPDLNAAVLSKDCYREMFSFCKKLDSVKCLATDKSAENCTNRWLSKVADTGTFVKANGVDWESGANGIPTGWTTETAVPEYNIVIPPVAGGAVTGPLKAAAGTVVTLTIDAYSGYELSSISAGGVTLDGSGNTRTFTMPATDVTVSVAFRELPMEDRERPLTIEAIEDGFIDLTYPWSTFKYRKNGGEFQTVSGTAENIPVVAGDKITLYADGSENTSGHYFTIRSFREHYVYGNIMSLLDSSNFKEAVTISQEEAFSQLFSSLMKTHPEKSLLLPATTLSKGCYKQMFKWSNLTRAPELPATDLAESCYESMFQNCAALTKAPDLNAVKLVKNCYKNMFDACHSLNYVKCLATNKSASGCTFTWLHGVADTGTFVKANGVDWMTDISGIPSGWTVQTPIPEYSIATSGLSNGTVTASVNSKTVSAAMANATVTLAASPATGYKLSGISVAKASGGTVSLNGSGDTRTFTMPAENVTVSATFTALNYTITFNANNERQPPATATQTFTAGTPQTLRTIATLGFKKDGFKFVGWLTADIGAGLSTAMDQQLYIMEGKTASYADGASYTATADTTLYALWDEVPNWLVEVTSNEGGTVTATPSAAPAGSEIALSVNPATGYQFSGITVTKASGGTVNVSGGLNSKSFVMPECSVTVSAVFAPIDYLVSVANSIPNGSIGASKTTDAHIGDTITITGIPSTGYALDTVTVTSGSNNIAVSGSGNTRNFTMPAGNVTINASFAPLTYSIAKSAMTNGDVTVAASSVSYGSTVTLTIKPNAGYELGEISAATASGAVTLSGEGKTSGSARTFAMPAGNVTISATFAKTHLGTKDKPDAIGDIVFNDGTATPYTAGLTLTDRQKAAAIAVICYADQYNEINGLGLKQAKKRFCKSEAGAYAKLEQLDEDNGFNNTYIYIKQAFKNVDYSEENYPAVWWATHYTGSNNLGSYKDKWYLPAVNEYRPIYDNLTVIQSALALIGSEYADPIDTSSGCQYGSSTQEIRADGSFPNWIKTFKFDGNISLADKIYEKKILVLRPFD